MQGGKTELAFVGNYNDTRSHQPQSGVHWRAAYQAAGGRAAEAPLQRDAAA